MAYTRKHIHKKINFNCLKHYNAFHILLPSYVIDIFLLKNLQYANVSHVTHADRSCGGVWFFLPPFVCVSV